MAVSSTGGEASMDHKTLAIVGFDVIRDEILAVPDIKGTLIPAGPLPGIGGMLQADIHMPNNWMHALHCQVALMETLLQ